MTFTELLKSIPEGVSFEIRTVGEKIELRSSYRVFGKRFWNRLIVPKEYLDSQGECDFLIERLLRHRNKSMAVQKKETQGDA